MTGACLKGVTKCERRESGITTSTTTGDDQSLRIDFTAVCKIASAIHAVVNVHYPPFFVKSLTILPPVAGASAVIHVQHRESPARPILNRKAQRGGSSRGWTAVTFHNQ